MSDTTRLRWRFMRARTGEGEKYFWELVQPDGTVVERIPADISPPRQPPPAGAPDDSPPLHSPKPAK